MLPKRAFVTFINENYKHLVDKLVKSVLLFSEYPIIIYTYNFDYIYENNKVYVKRLDDNNLYKPKFINTTDNNLGVVDRADYNTYYTLSRKNIIILDALYNGLEEGIFLDADGIVRENIDESFDYINQCENYPLIGKGLFEYMMLNGKGNPQVGNALEMPIMNLLGIRNRTMHYVQTNFILFTEKCIPFFEECVKISNNKNVLNHNLLYAPYHDETIMNVVLWKYGANKHLPLIHYNLSSYNELINFVEKYNTGYVNDCPWHYIPQNKNDIKYFHGCKSVEELDKCIEYLSNNIKNKNEVNVQSKMIRNIQPNTKCKIAIVTLYDINYDKLAEMSIPNKIDYAKKHNYDLVYFDDVIDKSRPPQWSKVKAIESVLHNYDWVWWIDIDALIMEFDIMLESLIDDNYDVIFTKNKYSFISNGSSFFKNTKLTFDFLRDCYDLKYDYLKNVDVHSFDHEQQSMRLLIQNEEKYRSKIKLIDERDCNSYCKTENFSVLNSYPYWNTEPNIYQNGDFVIQFCGRTFEERLTIFKEYYERVNKNDKTIIIIDCFATTEHKLNILRQCISDLSKLKIDILLVTHCTIPVDIQESVTYFIYDKNNEKNEKNVFLNWWNVYPDYNVNVYHNPAKNKTFGHEFPIIKSIKNSLGFVKNLGYKSFYFTEFDCCYDDEDLYKLKKLKSDINFLKKDFLFFQFGEGTDLTTETIFFMGNVVKFYSIIDSYFPNDVNEFNKNFTYKWPFTLEHLFVNMMIPFENNTFYIKDKYINYFNGGIKNKSSYVDVTAYIIPDSNKNYYITVSNQNKDTYNVDILYNNKKIYNSNVNFAIYPALKLVDEGEYTVKYYNQSDTKEIKTITLNYSKNNLAEYDDNGIIEFK